MSKKKLTRAQAFQKALRKWSDIIEGKPGVDPWSDCALCTLAEKVYGGDDFECSCCPLVQYGGYKFRCNCNESPWKRVSNIWEHHLFKFPRTAAAISAAMAMYLAILMARDSRKG